MKIDKRNPQHWLLLLQQGFYTLLAICARSVSARPKRPRIVLYGHQLSGNLKALYDEWQRAHSAAFDMYFLSLDPRYSQELERQGVRVLRCSNLRDMLLAGRSSIFVTDHGLHAMRWFITFTDIVFIDVWHGIPFKGFIPGDFRVQQRYDEVWVSSPLLKKVYQEKFGFNSNIVRDIGYARADKLFRKDPPDPTFRSTAGIPPENRIVLYAPTWKQDDQGRELFPFDEKQDAFIRALSGTCDRHGATLVIRSHLNATIGQQTFRNVVYCPMSAFPDTEGLLLQADLLICDWSSIAFDYLALYRPTIFLEVEPPFKNGFSLGPEYRFGQVAANMAQLESMLDRALQNPGQAMAERRDKYDEVSLAVYGESRDGLAASRQLERLEALLAQDQENAR